VGIGLLVAPSRDSSAGIAEEAVFLSFLAVVEDVERGIDGLGRFVFSFSVLLVSSAFSFFFFSAFAIASASHAAFTFPRDAGRLLSHFADFWSPLI
jgi:hypothetical protein